MGRPIGTAVHDLADLALRHACARKAGWNSPSNKLPANRHDVEGDGRPVEVLITGDLTVLDVVQRQ
jgi:hypothetical protein